MKELLAVILVINSVVGEAPYAPSGWRPNGPAFELPRKQAQQPSYLPPLDPRNPRLPSDIDGDVSVQGLPAQEQVPQFQLSPVSGLQYIGPAVQADVKALDDRLRFAQFQAQQQQFREIERQRQIFSSPTQAGLIPQSPASTGTTPKPAEPTTASKPDFRKTTESLNEGEVNAEDTEQAKDKASVEITKQNIQEYPPELFLNPLAQIRFVSTPNGGQFGRLVIQTAPEAVQKQAAVGFDGPVHLAALQSVLAQRNQVQNLRLINAGFLAPGQTSGLVQQYQLQPVVLQPATQLNQFNQPDQEKPKPVIKGVNNDDDDDEEDDEKENDENRPESVPQPQFVGQQPQLVVAQPQTYQPQQVQYQVQTQLTQPQSVQPQLYVQPQADYQHQLAYQPQLTYQPQAQIQSQDVQFQQPQVAYQAQQQFAQQNYQPQFAFQQQQFVPQQNYQTQEIQQIQQPQLAYQPQFVQQNYQPQEIQPQSQLALQQQNNQPQEVQSQTPQLAFHQQNYQPQQIQPQQQFVQQNYQPQIAQPQLQQQLYQSALNQDQQQYFANVQQSYQQGQSALQSGLNNDDGDNGIEKDPVDEDKEQDNQDGSSASAVATAFGARTRPRVYTRYGAPEPAPVPTESIATTESDVEEVTTEEAPTIAQATAVANGGRRKNSKFRALRTRPVFTVDRSGHLVLAQATQAPQ